MLLNTSKTMKELISAEHFKLFVILEKMVDFKSISKEEMENILAKSGLIKIEEFVYQNLEGAQLVMKPQ